MKTIHWIVLGGSFFMLIMLGAGCSSQKSESETYQARDVVNDVVEGTESALRNLAGAIRNAVK
jgi:hypothetical protein